MKKLTPVTLPFGRARLATRPMFLAIVVASVIAATAIAVARTRQRAVGFDATESQSLTQAVG
jgi:hypothetical protein